MSSSVLVHCSCTKPVSTSRAPPSEPPLSFLQHHPLAELSFCEECDAIRCNNCVVSEIACFYCPSCLFEVPSASVRGERNRCARNCFQCPQCDNTLATSISELDQLSLATSSSSTIQSPSYYLSCSACFWDSKQVGISFEKPTGLAQQLQKMDGALPESLEFDHLKDHLDTFLRQSQSSSHLASTSSLPSSSISTSLRNVSSSKGRSTMFGLSSRSQVSTSSKSNRDDMEMYTSIFSANGAGAEDTMDSEERELERVAIMRGLKSMEETSTFGQRSTSVWKQPILSASLRPQRTLLQSKRSKRCPACAHILIKPDQKSSSIRYKIKLIASNYLPSISLYRRPPAPVSRLNAIGSVIPGSPGSAAAARRLRATPNGIDDEPLRPGRTYSFELSFTNPLYEPIQVRLAVARPINLNAAKSSIESDALSAPYAVNLPSPSFSISRYAEAWEFEDDEEAIEYEDAAGGDASSPFKKKRSKALAGVVERKGNRTTVLMEVAVGKDTVGPIRASMLVTYLYQSEDATVPQSLGEKSSPKKAGAQKEESKSFSFWTLFPLGVVQPRTSRAPAPTVPATVVVGSS